MRAFIVDVLAWTAGVLIVLSVLFWAANAKAAEADLTAPLTLETRTALIAGVLMGIDMNLAMTGATPMTNKQAYQIATIIHKGTLHCEIIKCMLNEISTAIKTMRADADQKRNHPLEGEIIR